MKYSDAHKSFAELMGKLVTKNFNKQYALDLEIHRKLLSFFQLGDYYYYVFNLKNTDFDFVSPEIKSVLGYDEASITAASLINGIHPEDIPWFLNFENKVVEFFTSLSPDQVMKYKVRYDYRIKKANGEYIRILQQVVTLQFDEESGLLLRTFGIHTDITYLKKEGAPVLSIIGLDGEPSYINIDVKKVFSPTAPLISEREKEVSFIN